MSNFWKGFQQGMTRPVSFPAMWICYGIGVAAFVLVDRDTEGTPGWWHSAYRIYQWGMSWSVRFNDLGGFRLWGKEEEAP